MCISTKLLLNTSWRKLTPSWRLSLFQSCIWSSNTSNYPLTIPSYHHSCHNGFWTLQKDIWNGRDACPRHWEEYRVMTHSSETIVLGSLHHDDIKSRVVGRRQLQDSTKLPSHLRCIQIPFKSMKFHHFSTTAFALTREEWSVHPFYFHNLHAVGKSMSLAFSNWKINIDIHACFDVA